MKRDAMLAGAIAALLCSAVPSSSSDPLESRVRDLESDVRGLQDKASRTEYALRDAKEEISDLKDKQKGSRADIDLRDVKDEIAKLKDLVRRQDQRIATLEHRKPGLGWAHRQSPNGGARGVEYTSCGTNEVVTEIHWDDRTQRCAPLVEQ